MNDVQLTADTVQKIMHSLITSHYAMYGIDTLKFELLAPSGQIIVTIHYHGEEYDFTFLVTILDGGSAINWTRTG